MTTRALLAPLLAAGLLLSCRAEAPVRSAVPAPARVQNTPREAVLCALCEKPIPAGAAVTLTRAGAEPKLYRCVHCALTDQAATPAPSTVRARSPLSHTEIVIHRSESGWSVSPPTAVFLSLPEAGGECIDSHRAFPGPDEYRRYLAVHPELARTRAAAYTIDQLADLLASGLPQDGVRPDAPVQLLVVGMLPHLPFKQDVLPAIEGALREVGETAGARFVDATRPEGQAILAAHGIHQHLPVVMFLRGSTHARVEGREIDLRGFPGKTWSQKDLVAALRQAAGGETNPR